MTTQRAWVLRKTGQPRDVLKLENDYPVPKPTGNQLLIEVHAAALNPVGWKSISSPPLSLIHKTPAVTESDFSGVIAGGNLDGTGFTKGQEVFGIIPSDVVIRTGKGVLAEYIVADPNVVVPKPSNISHAEAASFPLAGLTAFLAIVTQGKLEETDEKRVFVNGGSGGVGAWAIQIAKAYGAFVVTTCSPESKALVTSLGADSTIDYRSVQPSLPSYLAKTYAVSKFDIVLDTIGSDVSALYAACPEFLKPSGQFVDVAGSAHIHDLKSALVTGQGLLNRLVRPAFLGGTPRNYKCLLLFAASMGTELKEGAALLESGKIKAPIDHIYSFEDALGAYDRQMSGRSKGKVIVAVVQE